jgi:hypothetical protein
VRFVVTGEWQRNDVLRLILLLFLGYVLLFWITNWLLYFQKMSLDPASVVAYYLGEPGIEFGRPPRPLGAMAETAHFHLFAMGMLVMTLTHLLLFLPVSIRVRIGLVAVAFVSALLDEGAGWLVRFVHPGFAGLKVAGFLSLQAALLGLTLAMIVGVIRPRRSAYADGERRRSEARTPGPSAPPPAR